MKKSRFIYHPIPDCQSYYFHSCRCRKHRRTRHQSRQHCQSRRPTIHLKNSKSITIGMGKERERNSESKNSWSQIGEREKDSHELDPNLRIRIDYRQNRRSIRHRGAHGGHDGHGVRGQCAWCAWKLCAYDDGVLRDMEHEWLEEKKSTRSIQSGSISCAPENRSFQFELTYVLVMHTAGIRKRTQDRERKQSYYLYQKKM